MDIRIAGAADESIVDGPGIRYTVFTQGCSHRCPGCHNPHTHDSAGGELRDTADLIAAFCSNPLLDGITLSGGEPFEQPAACAELARAAKRQGLTVWCYSGSTYEELTARAARDGDTADLLSQVDVLVDGRFVLSERDLLLRFRGSRNQRVIDMNATRERGIVALWCV